jgi:hypothetical protein
MSMPNTATMLEIMSVLSFILDFIAAWFFCCVMSVFIFPTILDRIVFYIPKMIQLYKNDEVFFRGIVWSVVETVFWIAIIVVSYVCFYLFAPNLFRLTTISAAAIIAWGICAFHIIYRSMHFDRTVKKTFYYVAYMRHIRPEALKEYQTFIDDLDALELHDVTGLLKKDLPYMHRQAVLRKQNELSRV